MKLVKCYISSFGKLKDYTLNFTDGLNVIKEDNGWGKSTLSMFLKSMFYGLKGSSKHSILENERKKYKPWGSLDKFGGYVDFEKDGVVYRLERYFGNKDAEDEIRLLDLATGKTFSQTQNLGERLFGIDEDGFFSTTYFTEGDFEIKGNTSLTAKYNSVLGVQSTEAFDNAVKKIDDAARKYKALRGTKGLIDDKRNEIKDISLEIDRASRSIETLKIVKADVENLENKISTLKNEISILNDKFSKASKAQSIEFKKKAYADNKEEYDRLTQELKTIDDYFKGIVPDQATINAYGECYKDLNVVQKNISILSEEITRLEATATVKPTKKNNLSLILGVSGGALCVVGVVLAFALSLIAGIIVAVLGVGLVVFGLLSNKRTTTNISNDNLEQIDKKKNDLLSFKSIEKEYLDKLNEFLVKYQQNDDDFLTTLFAVREKVVKRDAIISQIQKAQKVLDEYKGDLDVTAASSEPIVNLDSIQYEIKSRNYTLDQLKDELASKKDAKNRLEDIASSIPDLESKRANLREEEKEFIERHDLLTKTLDFLKLADVNLKTKYREPLENSFVKYLSLISDGKLLGAKIDIDFKVTVEERTGSKEQEFYSKGSRDLFEVCKRFALIDVLFKKERPFMILDDPFVSFDENKIEKALELIEKLSSEYQILYFVCHDSRVS